MLYGQHWMLPLILGLYVMYVKSHMHFGYLVHCPFEFWEAKKWSNPLFLLSFIQFIRFLSLNDQQVPEKLPGSFVECPNMLSEHTTQLDLDQHSYNTVNMVVCCHTGSQGGGWAVDFWKLRCPPFWGIIIISLSPWKCIMSHQWEAMLKHQ